MLSDENVYYNVIKNDIESNNIVDREFIEECIKDTVIYDDFNYSYILIKEHLNMSDKEFEEYINTSAFSEEWNKFCCAEQIILEELKKKLKESF